MRCTLCINSVCAYWPPPILCGPWCSKISKCFNKTCVRYEAAPFDGLSKHYSYCGQDPEGVIRIVLCTDPKIASVERRASEAGFKLKAISHAVEHENRAVRENSTLMNQSYRSGGSKEMTCTKKRRPVRVSEGNSFCLMCFIIRSTWWLNIDLFIDIVHLIIQCAL